MFESGDEPTSVGNQISQIVHPGAVFGPGGGLSDCGKKSAVTEVCDYTNCYGIEISLMAAIRRNCV